MEEFSYLCGVMSDDFIVSGFDSDANGSSLFAVDFASAKRLEKGGSTCDVYEATVQRRRVFVKRLKAEFRDNPVYRAAFNKEYDLGVSLSHPSLPRYVGFGGDYILMDFIEGNTLAELIKRGDRRLKNKRFVRRLLLDLVDVVEYLHNRNIVHCDIKADNIIISPYDARPLTLIDLDKAYTSWLDSTSGDPSRYDCEECADGVIDIRGIGMVASRLGLTSISAACKSKDATLENVRKKIKHSDSSLKVLKWATGIGVVIGCFLGIWLMIKENKHNPGQAASLAGKPRDTLSIAPGIADGPTETVDSPLNIPATPTATSTIKPDNQRGESTASSLLLTDSSTEGFNEINEIVNRYYGPLQKRHRFLRQLANDPTTNLAQLQIAIKSYCNDQMKAQTQIIQAIIDTYGLHDHPSEAQIMLGKSKEWRRFMQQDNEINQLYYREIGKREQPADSLSP